MCLEDHECRNTQTTAILITLTPSRPSPAGRRKRGARCTFASSSFQRVCRMAKRLLRCARCAIASRSEVHANFVLYASLSEICSASRKRSLARHIFRQRLVTQLPPSLARHISRNETRTRGKETSRASGGRFDLRINRMKRTLVVFFFPRLSFLRARAGNAFYERIVSYVSAMFIDPDDCKLGRRLEADRARGIVRDRRCNSRRESTEWA